MTMANRETRGFQDEATGQQSLPRAEREDGASAREQIREVKNQVVDQAKHTIQRARERAGSSLGEGVTIDAQGNVYGADFLGTVRKFAKK